MDIRIRGRKVRCAREPFARQAARAVRAERRPVPYLSLLYSALVLALLTTVTGTVTLEGSDLMQQYGPNLTTELLGIIATLTFVQRLLAREERARKLRAAVGPLRKCRAAFTDFLDGWSTLLKGAYDPRRTEMPRTFEELFTSHYTNDLASLDPRSAGADGQTCTQLAIPRLVCAQRRLREVISIYGAWLDPAYLEAIDELADDTFVPFLEQLAGQNPSPLDWRVGINQSRGHREGHFVRLVHALTVHNQLSNEAGRFRSRHLAPNTPSLALQRRADHDLTVPLQLGRDWWSATPALGDLRSL